MHRMAELMEESHYVVMVEKGTSVWLRSLEIAKNSYSWQFDLASDFGSSQKRKRGSVRILIVSWVEI